MTKVWKSKLRNSDERLKASGSNCQKDLTQEGVKDHSRFLPALTHPQAQSDLVVRRNPMVLTDPEGAVAICQQISVQEFVVKTTTKMDKAKCLILLTVKMMWVGVFNLVI
mmetsp:Transcript_4390/g.8137  ORF Transcript_4390/g.8137 Transcript_4390/m.8137 type:complete len:110 (+) Transcript_4390:218-547(+)